MPKAKTILVACFLWVGLSSVSEAQLFRRRFTTNQSYSYGQNIPAQNGHYGYPAPLDGHLAAVHGVNARGLTHEQMLDAHDAAHRGQVYYRPAPIQQRVCPAPPPQIIQRRTCPAPVCRAPRI